MQVFLRLKSFILKIGYLLLLLVAIPGYNALGQHEPNQHTLSNEKKEKLANKLMAEGSYYNAIDYYKEILEKDTSRHDIEYKIGEAYFISRDYADAEPYFAASSKRSPRERNLQYYYWGECLRYMGEYMEAKEKYQSFRRVRYRGADYRRIKSLNSAHIRSCNWALNNSDAESFKVKNLGEKVNSNYTDFSPWKINDTTLVFASLRSDTIVHMDPDNPNFVPVQLYQTSWNEKIKDWSEPVNSQTHLHKEFIHTANPAFSQDSTTMYFTWCKPHHGEIRCHIYKREWKDADTTWGFPKKLHHRINRHRFTSTMPTEGRHTKGRGRRKRDVTVLYFVSNRPGGKGGMDIWYSEQNKRGKFTKPVNCGRRINTPGDEVSPYYINKTKTMYFSSNYHENYGGYDIFKSVGYGKRWRREENLTRSINTSYDDTYYVPDTNDISGFFVSNRPGGHTLMSETCCDDIYYFDKSQSVTLPLIGIVYDRDDTAKSALNNNLVELFMQEGENDTLIDSFEVNNSDDRKYKFEVVPNQTYFLRAKKDGYNMDTVTFTTSVLHVQNGLTMNTPVFKVPEDTVSTDSLLTMNSESEKEIIDTIVEEEPVVAMQESESEKEIIDTVEEKVEEKQPEKEDEPEITMLESESEKEIVDTVKERIEEKQPEKEDEPEVTMLESESEKEIVEEVVVSESAPRYNIGDIISIVYHGFDQATHQNKPEANIDVIIEILKANPKMKIQVESHTDSKGPSTYNQSLSQRRCNAVRKALLGAGISSDRLSIKAFGESKPAAPNTNKDGSDNPAGRAKNRRTEFRIVAL